MEDVYDNLNVTSLDGSVLKFEGIPKQLSLTRFRSVVALKIQRQTRKYVPPNELNLMVFGEEMTDNDKTLASYGIQDDDTITRVDSPARPAEQRASIAPSNINTYNNNEPPPYAGNARILKTIFIQDSHMTHALADVPLDMTVRQLFTRLKNEKAIDIGSMGIVFGGKQLVNYQGATMMDLGINENSTLMLFARLPGGQKCEAWTDGDASSLDSLIL